MFASLDSDEETVCYLPRYPTPSDPFQYRPNLKGNPLTRSPQSYNIEAFYRQGRTLLDKQGARHIKRMRRWVEGHVDYIDGLPGQALLRQVYAADDGYSAKQLELVSAAASVASFFRCHAANLTGLEVELFRNLYSKSRKEVEAQYLLTLDVASADMAHLRLATQLICDLYEDLLQLFPSLARGFEQQCSDYQFRSPFGDADRQWSVTAEDRRTKEFVTEYCTDEADAKSRFALMRDHKYRFKSLVIEAPGEGTRRYVNLFKGLDARTESETNDWPFPE